MECKEWNRDTKCAEKNGGIETGQTKQKIQPEWKTEKKKSICAPHMKILLYYIVTTNVYGLLSLTFVCHFHHIVAVFPTLFSSSHILTLSLVDFFFFFIFIFFLLFTHFHSELFNPHIARQRVHLTQRIVHTMQSNLCNQSPVPYSLILEMRSVSIWKHICFFSRSRLSSHSICICFSYCYCCYWGICIYRLRLLFE